MNFAALPKDNVVGKALRLPLRLIPTDFKMPILQGPMRGKKWIVGSAQHGCWLGSYEFEMQTAFRKLIKPGDVVYDLGANVGFYSLLASILVGPSGRVFSFEPAPRNLRFLYQHLRLNGAANCTVWEAAIGACDGEGKFDFDKDYASGHLGSTGSYNVKVVGLGDKRIADLPPPNMIKCDIEGAEYDALVGASAMLTKHMPTIFLSTHSPLLHQQCCAFLTQIGYKVSPFEERPSVDYSKQMLRSVLAVRI